MRSLDYGLYDIMEQLSVDHRWDVLTVIMLRCDSVRNRSWPAMRTIAKKACPTSGVNGNLEMATRAKKWLMDHGAIELVPYKKRVGPELLLPRNRHVYQLTGVINFDGKIYPYWYLPGAKHVSGDETTGPEDVSGDEVSPDEVSGDEISPDETNLSTESILNQSNLESEKESSSIKEDDLIISIFRSLENAETTLALDRELTIAWCEYVIWRRDQTEFKKIGVERDYVFRMVEQKEPVAKFETLQKDDRLPDNYPTFEEIQLQRDADEKKKIDRIAKLKSAVKVTDRIDDVTLKKWNDYCSQPVNQAISENMVIVDQTEYELTIVLVQPLPREFSLMNFLGGGLRQFIGKRSHVISPEQWGKYQKRVIDG